MIYPFILAGTLLGFTAPSLAQDASLEKRALEFCPEMNELLAKDPNVIQASKTELPALWMLEQRRQHCLANFELKAQLQAICTPLPLKSFSQCFQQRLAAYQQQFPLSIDGIISVSYVVTNLLVAIKTAGNKREAALALISSNLETLEYIEKRKTPADFVRISHFSEGPLTAYMKAQDELISRKYALELLTTLKKPLELVQSKMRSPASNDPELQKQVSQVELRYEQVKSKWAARLSEIPLIKARIQAMESEMDRQFQKMGGVKPGP